MSDRDQSNEIRAPRKGRPPRTETGRKKRIPLGTPTTKLACEHLVPEGYVGRIIKGEPARLQRAQAAGYEFVTDPSAVTGGGSDNTNSSTDSRVSFLVGRYPDGKPRFDYLMIIPQEFYDEDQLTKQRAIDEVDNTIRRGHFNEKAGDERYIPDEGIKIP